AAAALAQEGVEATVLDLRTLAPLDTPAIVEAVSETGRVVVVEEGWLTGGVGAELSARITEACFDQLQAPVRRVAAADVPVPCAHSLEQAATPNWEAIGRAALEVVAY
ncbi:MAG: pyruvate dehydrogenase complex E1 component subunit beta, partial [Armatimonadetes bacterium]|nr:pyruvate dehydrogenase complex E1 component subunit beta [Armatimonadota bacterium]